jgi:hypothetical protein
MKYFTWILTLYIFVLSLAPNLKGGEYFKIYELVEHYVSHQTGEKNYTDFISFINDHYSKNDHHEKEHHELPFKNHTINTVVLAHYAFTPISIPFSALTISERTASYFYQNSFYSKDRGSIWNPPQEA